MESIGILNPLIMAGLVGVGIGVLIYVLLKRKSSGEVSTEPLEWFKALDEACRLSHDALIVINRNYQIVFANHAAHKLSSIHLHEPVSQLDDSFLPYLIDEQKEVTLEQLVQRHRLNRSADKTVFREIRIGEDEDSTVQIEISTYRSQQSRQIYYIILLHDQSCEKKLLRLHHLNSFTGLSNQFKAFGDITQLTAKGNKRNRFAIMMLELDNASYLRSMLGYAEVDNIINITANVLRDLQNSHQRISVYHLNYVNFMVLLRGTGNFEELHTLFKNFQLLVQENYNLRGKNQSISFSAGVSLYPKHGTLYSLLNSAFGALAKAQEQGSGQLVVAGDAYEKEIDQEIHLNNDLQRALKAGEIKLYFQPIYDARDHSLVGAEVLSRWHHPDRGIIMPDIFIPVAERSGLIMEFGRYIINEALRHLSSWSSFGFPPLRLTVNLSLRELESPEFIANLTALLYKYDIGECELKFEITEHTSMVNPELTHSRLNEIRQLGIGIALDDFGTGYSSFAHLAEFPIETLKIDRGFVSDITQNPSHQHIVSTMIKLGHSLGMTIVAEGVESKEDAVMLRSMGADYLQGYYFSRPMPKLEFQYLLTHPA